MEERGPPSTSIQVFGGNNYPNSHHHLYHNLEDVRSGTYVVQVPKDRIYRTPPPENAAIAEQRRNAPAKKQSGCPIKCVLITIIVFLLLLGLIGGIVLAVVKKDDPRFRVKRVRVTTKGKTRQNKLHEFDITLASRNPNSHTIIAFDDHGKTSLSFKNKKFANGKFPSSEQDPKNSKDVKLTLTSSSKTKLPTEIQKSMNETVKSKKHVDISLEFRVPVKMKVGTLEMKSKTISMLCHFKVNKLAKNSRVLSQDCDYSTRVN